MDGLSAKYLKADISERANEVAEVPGTDIGSTGSIALEEKRRGEH
jgi:hypothetical protein